MKKITILFLFLSLVVVLFAQRPLPQDYELKAKIIGASIMPVSGNIQYLDLYPVVGMELAVEYPSNGRYAWQYYWNLPDFGLALQVLDLGNPNILGYSTSLYPYMSLKILKSKRFSMSYRIGAGLSYITKTWFDGVTDDGMKSPKANTSIGSNLNVYLTTGFDLRYHLNQDVDLTAESGFIHMSNGSVVQPNGGLNMTYGSLGVSYIVKDCYNCRPPHRHYDPMPYDISVNASTEMGLRELYYKDKRQYWVGNLHVGATKLIKNWYGLGLGLDLFYDGAFVRQGSRTETGADLNLQKETTHFNRYYIIDDDDSHKYRVGLSIGNEFIMGRMTAFFDLGFYLYDGVRNNYTIANPDHGDDRPFVYLYDIDKEDGWNYVRFGMRYRVFRNFYTQISLKAHGNKAEFLSCGIAYVLPFKKNSDVIGDRKGFSYTPLFYHRRGKTALRHKLKGERYIKREMYKQRHIKRLRKERIQKIKDHMKAKEKAVLKRKMNYKKKKVTKP